MGIWTPPPTFTAGEQAGHITLNQLSGDLSYLRPSDPFSRTIDQVGVNLFAVTNGTLVSYTIPPQGFNYMFRVNVQALIIGNENGDVILSQIFYLFDQKSAQQKTVQNGNCCFSHGIPWISVPGGTAFSVTWNVAVIAGSGLLANTVDGSVTFMSGEWVPIG